jgi:hypothetical protein
MHPKYGHGHTRKWTVTWKRTMTWKQTSEFRKNMYRGDIVIKNVGVITTFQDIDHYAKVKNTF